MRIDLIDETYVKITQGVGEKYTKNKSKIIRYVFQNHGNTVPS